MSILVDWQIRELSKNDQGLLHPFVEGKQGDGVISYGLTHAGYDLRLGYKILVFKNTYNEVIDPKRVKSDESYQSRIFDKLGYDPTLPLTAGERVVIPPGSYILGNSLEYIRMPNYLKGTVIGKSTLARVGVHVNTTPIEPGWHGYLTIEIANETPAPVCVYCGEGVAQLEFHTLAGTPKITYAEKGEGGGKYQSQGEEPVPARVR